MGLPEPTPIKGICASCGCSIPIKSEGDITSTIGLMYGGPKLDTHLCANCASNVADIVIAMRAAKMNPTPETLAEFRRSRLRELLPANLFADVARRRAYHMKELLMLRPTGSRVLVKRVDAPKPTSSTIIIPETADGEKSSYALVFAVGPKVTEKIEVGDTVILTPYCGSPVQVVLDDETLDALLVTQDDCVAVVED